MARLGLKKQGTLWGLFEGNDLLIDTHTSPPAKRGARGGDAPPDPVTPEQSAPVYENNTEYRNVREAWHEASSHPTLEVPERQQERLRLDKEVKEIASRLESQRGPNKPPAWTSESEALLEAMMRKVTEILKLVGLSLHRGLGGHVGTNETKKEA